ncbi:MFS transporter [Ahniella affigens]|uniref:MFS transporter n=2 Tax=Ahniella affigens TaxID=2021234 RepID=A0A2P1PZA5_9GAMM|nr:MFS transporter [Ahniella affigens]
MLGMLMFLCLFTAIMSMRPVRETMGVAGGVRNLPWLFTGTFVATLLAMPVFGYLARRMSRHRLLAGLFSLFALNLLVFAVLIARDPHQVWVARSFYVWLSVFNLMAASLIWSVLADVLVLDQAKRLFGLIAAGASAGGIVGPIVALQVAHLGLAGILVCAACCLFGSIAAAFALFRWRQRQPATSVAADSPDRALGGSPLDGAAQVLRSRYLLGIAVFVLLLASVSTFLYVDQARWVERHFSDPNDRTEFFAHIDLVVQVLSILVQMFLAGRIAQSLGVVALLTALPVLMALGFLSLAIVPGFGLFVGVMVLRRAGEYALIRPGREMLFTTVPTAEKYKAKNFIDTVVYRAADALSSWLESALRAVESVPWLAPLMGAAIAVIWAGTGRHLARTQAQQSIRLPGAVQ